MSERRTLRVAAVQLEAELGNVDVNLERCERLADEAGRGGAEWIVLPEFFTTGVAYRPELVDAALAPDGEATEMMASIATRHGAHVGGSFLARDPDGHVRNAFLILSPDGEILGRHDKDIPTMWENALYIGGDDPGRIDTDGLTVGVALCWELMRTQTVERLRGAVDLVAGGSGWWSIPAWPSRWLSAWHERRNAERATRAPQRFALHVGAPVIHAAHAGSFSCPWPGIPANYRGHYEGGAQVVDHNGRVLAFRDRADGEGVAAAKVEPRRGLGLDSPDRFWLQKRGSIAALAWAHQNPHGRRQYRRNVSAAPSGDRSGGQQLVGADDRRAGVL